MAIHYLIDQTLELCGSCTPCSQDVNHEILMTLVRLYTVLRPWSEDFVVHVPLTYVAHSIAASSDFGLRCSYRQNMPTCY